MIDTHSHIYQEEFDVDRRQVVENAEKMGVSHVILANVDSTTIDPMKRTAAQFSQFCSMAMGLHPTSVNGENLQTELAIVRAELEKGGFCAIGEIGIDLYWDKTYIAGQQKAFETQLDWALQLDLPVIIHTRKAFAETFASLAKFKNKPLRGVFHCFGGGIEEARKILSFPNFYFGIGGVATYKNSSLPELLTQVPLDKILLETDAPYLAPVPCRGKRNEPQFLAHVAKKMADIYQVSLQKIDETTTKSAKKLFGI